MTGVLTPVGALSYNGARWRVTDSTAGSPSTHTVEYNHAFQVGDLITLSGMVKQVVDGGGATFNIVMLQPRHAEWRVTAVPAANKVTVSGDCVGGAPLLAWLTYPGWLPCLGQRLEGLYPALSRKLGTAFGGADLLPNFTNQAFCVGMDIEQLRVRAGVFGHVPNGATARGATGGESAHTTVAAELPPHVHYANAAADELRLPTRPVAALGTAYDGAGLAPASGYMGRVVAEYGDQIWLDQGYTAGTYTPSGNIVPGEPHENRPPLREMFPLIFAGSYQ